MSSIGELLHQGSVKDIYKSNHDNQLIFKFSDRYSVFDWGEMPDQLEHKGKTLALMGGLFFRWLEKPQVWKNWQPQNLRDSRVHLNDLESDLLKELSKTGLLHHYCGQVPLRPDTMIVKEVVVPKLPEEKANYDYSFYQREPENCLVPLEVIFRFGVPEGSSLLNRVDNKDYLRVLGLNQAPCAGEWFSKPVLEFSTKLESSDRYMSYEEAQRVAGLSDYEFSRLHALTTLVALRIKDLFQELGVSLWDGKFEWAFGSKEQEAKWRPFVLVDSIGPDELRLSYKDCKLSKEFLRGFYRQSIWLQSVEVAKKEAKKLGSSDWKSLVLKNNVTPQPLSTDFKKAAEGLYLGLAHSLREKMVEELGEDLAFETAFLQEAPGLDDLVDSMGKLVRPNNKGGQ